MKLQYFQHKANYVFDLQFSDAYRTEVDLAPLLQPYLSENALHSAQIDPDWGCLTFNNGMVDIELKTLYRYVRERENDEAYPVS